MKEIIQITRGERGSVTVVALVLLMALTLLGISASRTSTTDIRIAANEIPYKDGFFVAEGGVNRESIEVGNGNYGVLNIY
ncbi:MAG: hypothetical protein GY849_24455, partial [Deltaproteobacteria bacterium]|nr:hypothetical protein [Deltaproteobacteria bacterium]